MNKVFVRGSDFELVEMMLNAIMHIIITIKI